MHYTVQLRQLRRVHNGFTLIELLVVVAIISLLLGILIVAIGGMQTASRNTKDKSMLRVLASAAIAYSASNKGRLPSPRTETPANWSVLPARPSDCSGGGSIRTDALNDSKYRGWVTANNTDAPNSMNSCNELPLALEAGSLFPYVDNINAYLSPMDSSNRIRSYSMNGWVGVLYADDFPQVLDLFKGGKFSSACNLAFDTRTASRIKQPTNTFLFMPDNDPFGLTAGCGGGGWNNSGLCFNPDPETKDIILDVPGVYSPKQASVNYAAVDGRTSEVAISSEDLKSGKIREQMMAMRAANPYSTIASPSNAEDSYGSDAKILRDLILPGLIPTTAQRVTP